MSNFSLDIVVILDIAMALSTKLKIIDLVCLSISFFRSNSDDLEYFRCFSAAFFSLMVLTIAAALSSSRTSASIMPTTSFITFSSLMSSHSTLSSIVAAFLLRARTSAPKSLPPSLSSRRKASSSDLRLAQFLASSSALSLPLERRPSFLAP